MFLGTMYTVRYYIILHNPFIKAIHYILILQAVPRIL